MQLFEARNLYNSKDVELCEKYQNNKRQFILELDAYKKTLGSDILYQQDTAEGLIVVAIFKGKMVQQLLGLDKDDEFYFIKDLDLD